jgi:hypothetical protein
MTGFLFQSGDLEIRSLQEYSLECNGIVNNDVIIFIIGIAEGAELRGQRCLLLARRGR